MENQTRPVQRSVAIPTYGRDEILITTLKSVLEHLDPETDEVIVVDQSPQHDQATRDQLESWHQAGDICLIQLDEPSLTSARNRALAEASGDVVVFLDDDVLIHNDFLQAHMRHYAEEDVVGVTGQVYVCSDWQAPPDIEHPEDGTSPHFSSDAADNTDTFIGCNHSVRKSAALEAGGYDTSFIASAHCEDFDMGHRLAAGRHRVVYDPQAWVIHLHAPSGGCRVTGSKVWPEWTHTANLLLYAWRHGFRKGNFAYYIRRSIRTGPCRKEVLKRPWLWPWAWLSWVRANVYGWRHRGPQTEAEDL